MSLTSLIKGEFKDFFKEIIPTKIEFKTFSGKNAFSKEYIEYAEYKLENRYNSGVVGTAFDYLARWMIAKHVIAGREHSYSNLVAENGMVYCEITAKKNNEGCILEKYDKDVKDVESFIKGLSNIEQIIKISIFFAKLERIWRSCIPMSRINVDDLFEVEEEVFLDLITLTNIFQTKFIDSGIVTEDSIVIYNPSFGVASCLCGGADADIFIDGTLYDFKCSKKTGYIWNDVAQILGYYLLDNISKNNNDLENDLSNNVIKRIAFYKARFGEIEYYYVKKEDFLDYIEQLTEMLNYKEYIDNIKKRKEEEIRKRMDIEKEYPVVERIHNKLLKYTENEFLFEDLKKCKDKLSCFEKMKNHIALCYNIRIQDKIDGKKLRKKIESKGIDIKLLSEELGKSKSTINSWITEKTIQLRAQLLI